MKKHMRKYLIIIILVMIVALATFSYSLFIITDKQTNTNILNSTCLSFEIKNEENQISLQNAFPLLDEEGKKLTPYTFTVKNTCDAYMSYTISLETLQDSTLANKYVKVMLNSEAIANLDTLPSSTSEYYYEGSIASKVLGTYGLGSNMEEEFTLRLWMDGDATANEETMNKIFNSKIVIRAVAATYDPVSVGITSLNDAILANEYQVSDVELAKEKIANKQTVDTTKTAPIMVWQENISEASVTNVSSATLPAKSLIDTAFDVTDEETKVILGKGYTFNTETGHYDLVDYAYYDPTTIDYNTTDYYFCSGGHSIDANDKIHGYANFSECSRIYKVTNATIDLNVTTEVNPITQTEVPITEYLFDGYKLDQIEVESDKSDRGLYQTEDDYGTTYYYRGSVKNNYVYFGGFYWQIIRINGDGSIRIMYAGETPDAAGSDTMVDWINFNTNVNNPAYVGYMYGSILNTSLEQTQANEVDSDAKIVLESWYKENIADKNLSNYIADSGFCNDRSIAVRESGNGDGVTSPASRTTYYAAYERYYTTKTPTYKCANAENDLFTTAGASVGNKAATYPVGLITVDELMYAGITDGYMNRLSYVYQDNYYYTLSPSRFSATNSEIRMFYFSKNGYVNNSTGVYGLRPVINLKADTQISSGVGTSNNPFVVKTT